MPDHDTHDHTGVPGVGGTPDAVDVVFDPTGLDNTAATDVQAALEDFDSAITAAGGGGGATHSFLGYNTVGGSAEVTTANRWYAKQISPASNGIILSIGAHIIWGADDLGAIQVGLFTDVNGSPDTPNIALGGSMYGTSNSFIDLSEASGTRNYRWFSLPVGIYVTAGDYWIGAAFTSGSTQPSIHYDTSGTDRYNTPGGFRLLDMGYQSQTDSTRKYSLRASFLATS